MDLKGNIDASLNGGFAIKSDKSESSWTAGVLVHHEGGIDDSTELHEILFKVLFRGLL